MNIKIFGTLFFKIDSKNALLDHIIICIYDLLKKHILTLISTNENQINIYEDIKSLIFECVNKRYLELENPSYAMKNFICGCISILIISGITHSWQNCIEDLILNAERNKNNKPELIYICLKSIADCNSIMNFMNKDDNDEYWDDSLNFKSTKKMDIKDKLKSKERIIFEFINKVYLEFNNYEKNLKNRIMKAIVDIIIFWTQFELNILTNDSISNLIMDFTHQAIIEENPDNIQTLKSIAELVNETIISSQNCRLYEFYGKIEENDSIEETLEKINDNINSEEQLSIEKWLNFILDLLQRYKSIKNKNIEIQWALSKIFSSISENFIYLFFDLKNQRNVIVFEWVKNLISEKRIISWMFFTTIENMTNFITDYFRFYSYNEAQKESFKELLLNILLNIMNNCSYNKLNQNDYSQLQKEILFLNNDSDWNDANNNYIRGYEVDFSMDDIDITVYRNNAEYALCSIYLIFKSGFNSTECEIIPINKILSLININNNINNTTNGADDNLIKLDIILFVLKSIIKCLDNESSPLVIKTISDFINNLMNSSYIQNIRIFIDCLLLLNQFSTYLIEDEEVFKNVIFKLLLVTQQTNNNPLLLDSCYIVISNLFREFKYNNSSRNYFLVFLERYKTLCGDYSRNNNLQLENIIKAMFYSLGINGNNDENNEISNNNDNKLVSLIEEIIKPLLFENLLEKIRDITIIKKNIIQSYLLYKEIFYHISLCSKNVRAYILNNFISHTICNLIESNQDLQSHNNNKIFNIFPNDEEIMNTLVEFYLSISFNIVKDCPQLIQKINEIFVELFKKSSNFFKVIEFFECFYKYIIKNTKKTDNDYISINKYILDNFLLIMKLSINYINSKDKINEETFNKINLLLTTIIEVFPNIYIPEMNVNIFNDIISLIQFIFNLVDFITKEKREEINDKYISNIIKCLEEILNDNIIKKLSNFIQPNQRKEFSMNILYKTFKLLNIKEFSDLSIQVLPLLYFQLISFDSNLFINIFSQLLISTKMFDDMNINNIIKYIQLYFQNKNNIIDFIGEIINILLAKRQIDCLEFYFHRLNGKKSWIN